MCISKCIIQHHPFVLNTFVSLCSAYQMFDIVSVHFHADGIPLALLESTFSVFFCFPCFENRFILAFTFTDILSMYSILNC